MKDNLLLIIVKTFAPLFFISLNISVFGQLNTRLDVQDTETVYGRIQSTTGNAYWLAVTNNFGAGLRIDEGESARAFISYSVNNDDRFKMDIYNQSTQQLEEVFTIRNGNIGIGGITNPGEMLTVNGKICAKSLRITANSCWADYVFSKDYELMPLEQVETFITKNHHLPNVPSANKIENNGLEVETIITSQQEKIEELFLYVIDMHKNMKTMKEELDKLKKENAVLRKQK